MQLYKLHLLNASLVIQLRTTLRTLRTTDTDYIQTAEEMERGVEMDEAEKILVKEKAISDLESMMQNLANGTSTIQN